MTTTRFFEICGTILNRDFPANCRVVVDDNYVIVTLCSSRILTKGITILINLSSSSIAVSI